MPIEVGVGLVQLRTDPDQPAASRQESIQRAEEAFRRGATIVVLPEMCVPGYTTDPRVLASTCETLDGPTLTAWVELAQDHRGWVCGGFGERHGDRLFNSAVLVGPDGILIHYRKLHLFDREKDVFTPGDRGLNVARLPWGEVGVCICYDLRFVEVVRILALKGADLVCVPTAWLAGFDVGDEQTTDMAPQAHGALLQANLDQVFMACASQAGTAGRNDFLGSSIVASPFGRLVAGPMARDRTGVVVPTIDLDDIDRAHYRSERITPRQDRRSDVYALHVGRQTL